MRAAGLRLNRTDSKRIASIKPSDQARAETAKRAIAIHKGDGSLIIKIRNFGIVAIGVWFAQNHGLTSDRFNRSILWSSHQEAPLIRYLHTRCGSHDSADTAMASSR